LVHPKGAAVRMPFALPTRTAGVLAQRVADEYIVVVPATHIAHALSGLAARVWEATEQGYDARWIDVVAVEGVDDVIAGLTDAGLFVPTGVSRRAALRTGGVVGLAGLVALALPSPADAASNSPAVEYTLSCGSQTVTAGASDQPRQVFFTLYGAGGSSGTWTDVTKASGGGGGSGGFVTGSLTFPAGPDTSFIVFPGCSNSGGAGYNPAGFGQPDDNGASGYGGGGSGIASSGGTRFIVVGGGGGGGGSVIAGDLPPTGGNGAGIGAGKRGTTSSASNLASGAGGGGGTGSFGARGTPATTVIAPLNGTGIAPGGFGGRGGRAAQGSTSSAGGGGGGGYYGGGGGTGSTFGSSGGGGGGSAYTGGLTGNGSTVISGVILTVTNSGVAPAGGPGAGAAPAAFGAVANQGTSGQAHLTTLGGFDLIFALPN
jgi:hypothetical protein